MCEGETPSEGGERGSGYLPNEGMSVRGMETNFLGCLCVLQVILAYVSIVLCMCSGKFNDIYF